MQQPRFLIFLAIFLAALAVAVVSGAAGTITGTDPPPQADFSRDALDRRAPVVAQRSYRLKAGVRLLLFWIRRDDVGNATLTWRAGPGEHRILEFLVGSDPERAPRHINRWGFIAEEVRPPDVDLLGIMSKSDEQSVDDARSRVEAEGKDAKHPYVAIRTTIRNGSASGGVFRVWTTQSLTYRDLDALLRLIPSEVPASHTVSLPKSIRTGFLFAVEDLISRTLDRCRSGLDTATPAAPYVYNGKFYTLSLRHCDFSSTRKIGDRVFQRVIRAELETRNTVTANETSFRLEYGTEGDLKAVPLRIVFRPKWWFEAELLLGEPAGTSGTVRR